MFFSVAWSRLAAISLFLASFSFAHAREESLFTSSVTYCEPPETLLIQQFDLAYIASNQSVSFNISAASVEPNVNVSANILLNVYGMHLVNITVDLCDILSGALCPLPMYNFTGVDSIALPSSVDVSSRIPGIAYKVPDLEAFAQLKLIETHTGDVKACVQSTLSNGWSTAQPAVGWSTGALALLSLFSAVWQSLSPVALAPYRLLDLLHLYQTIASTGLFTLNYPSAYRAFTANFSWAMGLFPASSTSAIQASIDNTRSHTGGNTDTGGGSAIALTNRKLSPYNSIPGTGGSAGFVQTQAVQPLKRDLGLPQGLFESFTNYAGVTEIPQAALADTKSLLTTNVQTVTSGGDNVLQGGIQLYTNSVGIVTANAFMTIFLTALMFIAIALAALAVGYGVVALMVRSGKGDQQRLSQWKRGYPAFARAWALRLSLISLTPILIFGFAQWTLKDSWVPILFSVISILAILGGLGYAFSMTARLARRSSPESLYSEKARSDAFGPLYGQYRAPRYYYFFVLFAAAFVKAVIIAFGQNSGTAQLALAITVELAVLMLQILLKPHRTRGGDVLGTYLAVTRLVCTGTLIAFLEQLNVQPIPRVVIGLVLAVIWSVAVVVMFVNTLWHIVVPLVRRVQGRSARSVTMVDAGSGYNSDSLNSRKGEKRDIDVEKASSELGLPRPVNPTPERNVPLDPRVNRPYPASEVSPTHSDAPTHSTGLYSDADTTTLGSMLPRRWSLRHSPPSNRQSFVSALSSASPHSPLESNPSHSHTTESDSPSRPHEDRHTHMDTHAPTAHYVS